MKASTKSGHRTDSVRREKRPATTFVVAGQSGAGEGEFLRLVKQQRADGALVSQRVQFFQPSWPAQLPGNCHVEERPLLEPKPAQTVSVLAVAACRVVLAEQVKAMNDQAASNPKSANSLESLAFIWKHVERIAECMLVTQASGGIRARPMRGLARPDDNAIWFFTPKSAPKDEEILQHPQVCLCYADIASNTFLSLSGAMETNDDAVQIKTLWSPAAQAYFPGGPTDPEVLLLKFTPDTGEFWDAPSNPVVIAVQFIKSRVTGEKVQLGTNAKVAMGDKTATQF